ncbi:hypothetical protein SI859A1_00633 [Aurantimonas manganoxydans SI85-9A1]|uniref:Uncharacterized protein n=1 Tax=Aurantimonas manganoxydans (strain ATCC BAA-1229 / DSM 21871 / SI85-9A1) TaxID=287752 RepID=Q1YKL0_AURMS|nr:hypothetical protein SI859A1_00633 [Aurantimonas manganoxydans SI85-9A1]
MRRQPCWPNPEPIRRATANFQRRGTCPSGYLTKAGYMLAFVALRPPAARRSAPEAARGPSPCEKDCRSRRCSNRFTSSSSSAPSSSCWPRFPASSPSASAHPSCSCSCRSAF